jgi:hypothetical protein
VLRLAKAPKVWSSRPGKAKPVQPRKKRERVMDVEYSKRLLRLVPSLVCCRCGRKIRIGTMVHLSTTRHQHSRPSHRLFHLRCWNGLFR